MPETLLTVYTPEKRDGHERYNFFMVFPYMDHDLAGLLANRALTFSESICKTWAYQLLMGTLYLHQVRVARALASPAHAALQNNLLHRDLKAANLLIDNKGRLMICDFGLARALHPRHEDRLYTDNVVTRWYRAPELLLGDRHYDQAVDMWSVACIVGEMFVRRPVFEGNSCVDQLARIFQYVSAARRTAARH